MLYKTLLLIFFFLSTSWGYAQDNPVQQQIEESDKLSSLKNSLSLATDSLEVARLCQEIYRLAKFDLHVQNPDEGNYLMRALRIYENHEKWNDAGYIYNALGGIYYNKKQFPKARKYWHQAKDQYRKNHNRKREAVAFNNLSLTYFNDSTIYAQNQMKAYLDSTIALAKTLDDPNSLVSPYQNLGGWYLKKRDLESAEKYTELSLSISHKLNRLGAMQSGLFQLGMIKKEQGDIEQAIQLIEKSLNYDALRKTDPNYMDALLELSNLYSSLGDHKKGYEYQATYLQYKDTLFNEQQAKSLLDLEMAYKTEKKERIILEQNNELRLMTATSQFRKRLTWAVGIGILLLFGSAYLFRSYKFATKAKNLEEEYSKQLLASHEDERKRISRDLHDSVGQSLILIKNKVVLNQDDTTVSMVSKALEEVRTISKALHPAMLDKLGLTASIQKLIQDADELTGIFFSSEVDDIDGIFSKEYELQIYRILQESLNNMIKHAQTESALVQINNEEKKVTLLIRDYGIGFDITENTEVIHSLGMKTLKERTQIIGGKIIIDSTKNKGTSILLELDKPENNA
jgi:signal transduction histidine kinase